MLNGDVATRAQPGRASALLGSELADPHIDPTGKFSAESRLEPTPSCVRPHLWSNGFRSPPVGRLCSTASSFNSIQAPLLFPLRIRPCRVPRPSSSPLSRSFAIAHRTAMAGCTR